MVRATRDHPGFNELKDARDLDRSAIHRAGLILRVICRSQRHTVSSAKRVRSVATRPLLLQMHRQLQVVRRVTKQVVPAHVTYESMLRKASSSAKDESLSMDSRVQWRDAHERVRQLFYALLVDDTYFFYIPLLGKRFIRHVLAPTGAASAESLHADLHHLDTASATGIASQAVKDRLVSFFEPLSSILRHDLSNSDLTDEFLDLGSAVNHVTLVCSKQTVPHPWESLLCDGVRTSRTLCTMSALMTTSRPGPGPSTPQVEVPKLMSMSSEARTRIGADWGQSCLHQASGATWSSGAGSGASSTSSGGNAGVGSSGDSHVDCGDAGASEDFSHDETRFSGAGRALPFAPIPHFDSGKIRRKSGKVLRWLAKHEKEVRLGGRGVRAPMSTGILRPILIVDSEELSHSREAFLDLLVWRPDIMTLVCPGGLMTEIMMELQQLARAGARASTKTQLLDLARKARQRTNGLVSVYNA